MVLDKLMFWKKEDDDLDLDHDIGGPSFSTPNPPQNMSPFDSIPPPDSGFSAHPPTQPIGFQPQPTPQPVAPPQNHLEKDVQLLLSKIDTIKAVLDNIDQRLSHLENQTERKQQQNRYSW